jgi:hypothetical protein
MPDCYLNNDSARNIFEENIFFISGYWQYRKWEKLSAIISYSLRILQRKKYSNDYNDKRYKNMWV